MGILTDMEDASATEEPEETPAETPAPEEKAEVVALPKKPTGRRPSARDAESAIQKELKELRDSVASSQNGYRDELSKRDQEIARLNGRYEALSQQRSTPETKKVDTKVLLTQAQEKLDKGDYQGWSELYREAVLVDAEERISKLIPKQTQQSAPVQVPYAIQTVVNAFPDVMEHMGPKGEPIGWELAVLEDRRLALQGIPDGPGRYRKAFEAARASLPKKATNGYSAGSRALLSAVPPSRSAPADDGEEEMGVEITPYMREVAKRCGMTVQEYAKYYAEGNPKAVRRG